MSDIVVTCFSFKRNGYVNYLRDTRPVHISDKGYIVARPFIPLHPDPRSEYPFAYRTRQRAEACASVTVGPSDHDRANAPEPREWVPVQPIFPWNG